MECNVCGKYMVYDNPSNGGQHEETNNNVTGEYICPCCGNTDIKNV